LKINAPLRDINSGRYAMSVDQITDAKVFIMRLNLSHPFLI